MEPRLIILLLQDHSVKHNAGIPRRACSSAQGTSFRGPQTWVHCDLTNGTSCPARSGRRTATRMIAALGERAHDMAAEEARAAEDGDERIGGNCGHSALLGWAPAGSTLICCAPASRQYGSTQPRKGGDIIEPPLGARALNQNRSSPGSAGEAAKV